MNDNEPMSVQEICDELPSVYKTRDPWKFREVVTAQVFVLTFEGLLEDFPKMCKTKKGKCYAVPEFVLLGKKKWLRKHFVDLI